MYYVQVFVLTVYLIYLIIMPQQDSLIHGKRGRSIPHSTPYRERLMLLIDMQISTAGMDTG